MLKPNFEKADGLGMSARLTNFLGGWLLVLGIKEGLVECATVCVKSVVILSIHDMLIFKQNSNFVFFPSIKNSSTNLSLVSINTREIWHTNVV